MTDFDGEADACDVYVKNFDPFRDGASDLVTEDADSYARRMRSTLLPKWPEEVLIMWLHRHAGSSVNTYAFLGFENLEFERQTWSVAEMPGREVFRGDWFNDDLKSMEWRAKHSWIARYMLEHGTWNVPIVLLQNVDGALFWPSGDPLKSPMHLLEGHNRMSFFLALKDANRCTPRHDVWLASKTGKMVPFERT